MLQPPSLSLRLNTIGNPVAKLSRAAHLRDPGRGYSIRVGIRGYRGLIGGDQIRVLHTVLVSSCRQC
eukprot:1180116-Prorocentrum_minimum.AAC.3